MDQFGGNTERDFQIILPKQKRLKEAFAEIMARAGLKYTKEMSRHAYGSCVDSYGRLDGLSASERKPDDAIRKLQSDKADMAVIGSDKYIEAKCKATLNGEGDQFKIDVVMDFNCAACGMYIAAGLDTEINKIQDLEGMTIATSFPYSLKAWLRDNGVKNVDVIVCDGDTEDEVRDGSADAIFEIVDSGRSLKENALETKIWAYDISAVLVARADIQSSKQAEIGRLLENRLRAAERMTDTSFEVPVEPATIPIKEAAVA